MGDEDMDAVTIATSDMMGQTTEGPIDLTKQITVGDVIEMVDCLHNSNAPANADKALRKLQYSERFLQICWDLLKPDREKHAVQFYAANSLHLNVRHNWQMLNTDKYFDEFHPKLLLAIKLYALSSEANPNILERLLLTLAASAIRLIPASANSNVIQDFIFTLGSPNYLSGAIPSRNVDEIILSFLIYLREQFEVLLPYQDQKAKINQSILLATPKVYDYIHSVLLQEDSPKSSALDCLKAWSKNSSSLLNVENGPIILDLIYSFIQNKKLCSEACSTLRETFNSENSDDYGCGVIKFIPKVAKLREVASRYIIIGDECSAGEVYSFITGFAESHSEIMLKIIFNQLTAEPEVKRDVATIIQTVLECTSQQGVFGIDEKISDATFDFWAGLIEGITRYSGPELDDLICTNFDPIIDKLAQTLIIKCQYPSLEIYLEEWDDDQRDVFRCYRQEIADLYSIVIDAPRARGRLLANLTNYLTAESARVRGSKSTDNLWQGLESIIFVLKSVSDFIPVHEASPMTAVFETISQVESIESFILLHCTIVEMMPSFAEWLSRFSASLKIAFNLMFLGLESENLEVRLVSGISLKNLACECQTTLKPIAEQIVVKCSQILAQTNSKLNTNEKAYVYYTLGTVVMVLPPKQIMDLLNPVASPMINSLNSLLRTATPITGVARSTVIEHLTMLNSLIESLHIKEESDYEYEDSQQDDYPRLFAQNLNLNDVDKDYPPPALQLLVNMIPILELITTSYKSAFKYTAYEALLDLTRSTIKKSAKSLGADLRPVLRNLLAIIVQTYNPLKYTDILDAANPLYMLFRCDRDIEPILKEAFSVISSATQMILPDDVKRSTLAIDNYLKFANFIIRKFPEFFLTDQGVPQDFTSKIYKLAISSLVVQEKGTLAEVCNFISNFKQACTNHECLRAIYLESLGSLFVKIFNILADSYSTPKNAIEIILDLMFNVTDIDARETLETLVEADNFPTHKASRDMKARFVSSILHESNRRKFKTICLKFSQSMDSGLFF